MASMQNMTQAIMQEATEVAKVAIMAVKEENPACMAKPLQIMPKTGGSALKQSHFKLESTRQIP